MLRDTFNRLLRKITFQKQKIQDFWSVIDPICTFVDVGASYFYNQHWNIATQLPMSTMIQVDPNLQNLEYAQRQKIHAKVISVPYGLSRAGGLQKLYVTNIDSGSSVFEPKISPDLQPRLSKDIYSYFYPIKEVEIQTKKLIDIIPASLMNQPIALKLDTQGSEHEIIRGAETLLKTKQFVSIEIEASLLRHPFADGGTKFCELQPYLENFGYELVAMRLNHSHGLSKLSSFLKQGILSECDALFILNHREILKRPLEFKVASFFLLCLYGQFGDALRLANADQQLTDRIQNGLGKKKSIEQILRMHQTFF